MTRRRLIAGAFALAAARVPTLAAFDPALMREGWTIGGVADQPLRLLATDADGDGVDELLTLTRDSWYLMGYEARRKTLAFRYYHDSVSGHVDNATLVDAAIGDVIPGGGLEVVVLANDGVIHVSDLRTGAELGRMRFTNGLAVALALGDLDPSPGDEIAVCGADIVEVFRFGSTVPAWSLAFTGSNANRMGVGEVDGDAARELVIATGDGSHGLIVDAVTHQVEWDHGAGFGAEMALGDVDNDGLDEIFYNRSGGRLGMIDADTRSEKWSVTGADRIAIGDVDGDGRNEALVGWRRDTSVLDPLDGSILNTYTSEDYEGYALAIGDFDGDCHAEIASGLGWIATQPGEVLAQVTRSSGPMHAFAIGDVDGDGRTDIARASGRAFPSYTDSVLFVTDPHHETDLLEVTGVTTQTGPGFALAQLDNDPQFEILTTASDRVTALDGVTLAREWASEAIGTINAILVADLDRDGRPEVIVSGAVTTTEGAVLILDGATGATLWSKPRTNWAWDLRAADVDGDGVVELVYQELFRPVTVIDGVTHAQEWQLPSVFACIEVGDLDGDGKPEILAGDFSGNLSAFDAAARATRFTENLGSTPIHALRLADLDGDGQVELLVSRGLLDVYGGDASILEIRRAADRTLLWTSPPLRGPAGLASHIVVADIDDDGLPEIAISTLTSIRTFEYGRVATDPVAPEFPASGTALQAAPAANARCCPAVDLSWTEPIDAASPPVDYRIYRSTISGFTPSAATLVAETPFSSYRDHAPANDATYYYLVRAVDAAGNEDANVDEAMARTNPGDVVPGDQGNVLHALRRPAAVELTFPGATAAAFRLDRDDSKTSIGTTPIANALRLPRYDDVTSPTGANSISFYALRGLSPCSLDPGPR